MTDQQMTDRLARELMDATEAIPNYMESVGGLRFWVKNSHGHSFDFDPLHDASDAFKCVDALERRGWRLVTLKHYWTGAWECGLQKGDCFPVYEVDPDRLRAIVLAINAALDAVLSAEATK